MLKQLYIFALAQIATIAAPAFAFVSPDAPPAAADKEQLSQLETRFFAHEDVNRTLDERLNIVEFFVFGAKTNGSFHERVTRISDTCSRARVAAHTPAFQPQPSNQPVAAAHQPVTVRKFPSLTTYEIDDDEAVNTRPTVYVHRAAAVRQTVTVVDRIEWMEISIFGRKNCGGKIQKRVAKLESSVYGPKDTQSADPSITARVNKLWDAVNAS